MINVRGLQNAHVTDPKLVPSIIFTFNNLPATMLMAMPMSRKNMVHSYFAVTHGLNGNPFVNF